MRYNGWFGCKSFDMFCFFGEEWLRDKEWKISIAVTSSFKWCIENTLYVFPDSVSIRFDNHTPADSRVLCKISLFYQFVISSREVSVARSKCHDEVRSYLLKALIKVREIIIRYNSCKIFVGINIKNSETCIFYRHKMS